MRLEIIIDRKHQIPTATMEALRQELLKQLGERFPDLHVRVAPGSAMALTVSRASKEDRNWPKSWCRKCGRTPRAGCRRQKAPRPDQGSVVDFPALIGLAFSPI